MGKNCKFCREREAQLLDKKKQQSAAKVSKLKTEVNTLRKFRKQVSRL
jgi:hypothetical protein